MCKHYQSYVLSTSYTAVHSFVKRNILFEKGICTCRSNDTSALRRQACSLNGPKKPMLGVMPNHLEWITAGWAMCVFFLPHVRFYLIMSTLPSKSEDKLEKSPISTDQLQASSTTSNYDDLYDDISPELQSLASRKESHRASERV